MNDKATFHILIVGWGRTLFERLLKPVADKSENRFSCIPHPKYTLENWPDQPPQLGIHFFRDTLRQSMPQPDHQFLASLEQSGVPTVHNMIMGDRVVSKISYSNALGYATFLARRLIDLYTKIQPNVVIVGFDAIHSGLALAVARYMNIPAFALHFSVIPPGFACFCDQMSPAARVTLNTQPSNDSWTLAEASLLRFESKQIKAHAYIAPAPRSIMGKIRNLPQRISAFHRTTLKSRQRKFLQFTELRSGHNVHAAFALLRRTAKSRKVLSEIEGLTAPPSKPYVFFGLHFQPESSIDVWAPFFSNQMWVIELISRSIPPTHKLLVKIHKSDTAQHSRETFEKMSAFPGVQLVRPFADTRRFIQNADLVIAIQGTIGLEAALLGKPVIMLADSPVTTFPSASQIGPISDLPNLIQNKLAESPPARTEIIKAYASYLAPFMPASLNNWRVSINADEIDNYVVLFDALEQHMMDHAAASHQAALRNHGSSPRFRK